MLLPWSSFYSEVLVFVAGCPDPLMEARVKQASIEFFQRTRTWVEWLDPETSYGGKLEYDFDIPSQSDVARVERATVDGKPIEILSYRDAKHDWSRIDLSEQGLVSRDLKTFRLGNAVPAGQVLQVQVALTPSRNATGLPDDLFDKYRDDIVHGARAKLLEIPGTPFYEPSVALRELDRFESAIAANNVDSWRGLTASTPRARMKFC